MTTDGDAQELVDRCRELLDQLLVTHAPSGFEDEMRRACLQALSALGLEATVDLRGNVVARLGGSGPKVGFMAHMDEVALMVSRIHDDGKMEVEPLGGIYPWAFGEGPWEVIPAAGEPVLGVLTFGSVHTSERSGELQQIKTSQPVGWSVPRLDCKLSPEELRQRGVAVGRPVCVARSRKQPVYMGEYVAGYSLDDKGGVAALLLAAELLADAGSPDGAEVFFIFTTAEEIGTHGAGRAAVSMGLDAAIAVDVAPVAPEYPTQPGPIPAVIFKDSYAVYSSPMSELLAKKAEEVVGSVQRTIARSYGSDASGNLQRGAVSRGALIGFATENTHGFEVAHLGGIVNCARVIASTILSLQEAW